MRDPLLRSTNVLNALFHRGAIVCESDVDRSFYQEVNARLLVDSAGIRDSVFLNAQNKQTVRRLVEPLRKMGIPAVAVVDIDILKGDYALLDTGYRPRLESAHVLQPSPAPRRAHLAPCPFSPGCAKQGTG